MDAVILEINGRAYKLQFGLKCVRILGAMWEIPTMQGVLDRLSILDRLIGSADFELEVLDVLESVIIAAIKADSSNEIVTTDFDTLLDYMFENAEKMTEVFEGLVASMPTPDTKVGKSKVQAKKK